MQEENDGFDATFGPVLFVFLHSILAFLHQYDLCFVLLRKSFSCFAFFLLILKDAFEQHIFRVGLFGLLHTVQPSAF